MNETLRLLYDKFYTPLPMVESEQEVETCHRQLIERLDKPERKLVLQVIDAQNLMIEQRSVDSFICGFRLAWEMANELAGRKILCKRFSTKSRMALENRADSGLNPLITESHGGQSGMRAGTA